MSEHKKKSSGLGAPISEAARLGSHPIFIHTNCMVCFAVCRGPPNSHPNVATHNSGSLSQRGISSVPKVLRPPRSMTSAGQPTSPRARFSTTSVARTLWGSRRPNSGPRQTSAFFDAAPYHEPADPLERVLGYVAFRKAIIEGDLAAFTCLVGTMAQEVYASSRDIREACGRSIFGHAETLEADIEAARQRARHHRRLDCAEPRAAHASHSFRAGSCSPRLGTIQHWREKPWTILPVTSGTCFTSRRRP